MLRAKMFVEKLEHLQLDSGGAGVIDELAFAQQLKRGLELGRGHERSGALGLDKIGDRLHVEIENIQEQPARGTVGTSVRRVMRKEGVQGVHADDVRAFFCPYPEERRENG